MAAVPDLTRVALVGSCRIARRAEVAEGSRRTRLHCAARAGTPYPRARACPTRRRVAQRPRRQPVTRPPADPAVRAARDRPRLLERSRFRRPGLRLRRAGRRQVLPRFVPPPRESEPPRAAQADRRSSRPREPRPPPPPPIRPPRRSIHPTPRPWRLPNPIRRGWTARRSLPGWLRLPLRRHPPWPVHHHHQPPDLRPRSRPPLPRCYRSCGLPRHSRRRLRGCA